MNANPHDIRRRNVGFWLVLFGVLSVIVFVAWVNWETYVELLLASRPELLALAAVPLFLGHLVTTALAVSFVEETGSELTFRQSFRILSVTNVAKYIPGGVVEIGTRVHLGRTEGLTTRETFKLWLEPIWFYVVVGGAVVLVFGSFGDLLANTPLRLLGAVGLVTVTLGPIRHRLMRLVRLRSVEDYPESLRQWAIRVGLALAACMLTGVHGWLVLRALSVTPIPSLMQSTAAFLGAWIVGILVIPLPGGLGAREGALTLALSPWLTGPQGLLVAGLSRVIGTGVDFALAVLGSLTTPGAGDSPAFSVGSDE